MQKTIKTGRFAPSPSGRMHLGNVCSSLLAWLSVRSCGGEMVLRLEDLDPQRCKPEYSRQLQEDLRWLGLDWDRGGIEDSEGYRQSTCEEYYCEAMEQLDRQGLIYPCFCSRDELHAASAPHRSDGQVIYSGQCRTLSERQRTERARLRHPAMRVRVPDQEISFVDRCFGAYRENLSRECGDFIVRRSDGVYAYQLAVVVDDARMGITEVVRGCDLLDSTPRQIWLQQQLGLPTPEYCHIPLLLAQDGRRLSKRDRDMDLGVLRTRVASEELVGYLAYTLGIIEHLEPAAPRDLVSAFSWDRVRKEDIVIPQDLFQL